MQHTIAQKFRPTGLRLSPFARTVSRDTHLVFQPSVVEFHLRVPRWVTPRSFTNPQPGPTPGNVKLRLPPRQRRGISLCIRLRVAIEELRLHLTRKMLIDESPLFNEAGNGAR